MLSRVDLALIFSNVAWIYSYLQWGWVKIIPLAFLIYQHEKDPFHCLYFVLNLVGDIALHREWLDGGVLAFYCSHLLMSLIMLSERKVPGRLHIFLFWLACYLPAWWSTTYSLFIYTLISLYGIALAIPLSVKGEIYFTEAFILLGLSDIMVLGQLGGWSWLQPWSLMLYYWSQLLVSWTKISV